MKTKIAKSLGKLGVILFIGILIPHVSLLGSDMALKKAIEGLDTCVQNVDTGICAQAIADVLKLEAAFARKGMMDGGLKSSDLALIKKLSDIRKQNPQQVLESNPKGNWIELLNKAGISDADLVELLDETYADYALRIMDLTKNGKSKKRATVMR